MKKAFTMVELIFVIVILGVLAAVAVPKLAATRLDAEVSTKAHAIMVGVTEVASYAVSNGTVDNDISKMSNAISNLVNSGDAVINIADKKVVVKIGEVNDCCTIDIDSTADSEILKVLFGVPGGDSACLKLQSLINRDEYPIKLRGQTVVF